MMPNSSTHHIPVLLNEVLQVLAAKEGEVVVDATLGGGGHTAELLKAVGLSGRVIGLDADASAIAQAKEKFANQSNFEARLGNFANIAELIGEQKVDVILFDFGFSSDQLDDPERGFSFQASGPLDMRLDQKAEKNAFEIINRYEEHDIARIIKEYGEEINAKGIARAILRKRRSHDIETTAELFDIIKQALPGAQRHKAGDVARRTFQALRIEVNDELEAIQKGLAGGFQILNSGGRLAAISFHSLEDRIVKQFFAELKRGCICPPDFPVCVCGHEPLAKLLVPKPITASEAEQQENPRSKSAKLRAIEKI